MKGSTHVTSHVRSARRRLGLSQTALANAAGVSLATVQNVEAGRANPALSTLADLLAPLGLVLDTRAEPTDWGALIALGLPLAGAAPSAVPRDADTLRLHLGRAAVELARAPDQRRREALQALLFAAHSHFPRVTRRWLRASPEVRELLPATPSGRIIKLARVARAVLAEYL